MLEPKGSRRGEKWIHDEQLKWRDQHPGDADQNWLLSLSSCVPTC